jgi:hypothetical protein
MSERPKVTDLAVLDVLTIIEALTKGDLREAEVRFERAAYSYTIKVKK